MTLLSNNELIHVRDEYVSQPEMDDFSSIYLKENIFLSIYKILNGFIHCLIWWIGTKLMKSHYLGSW